MGAGLNDIIFDDLEWPLTRVLRSLSQAYKSKISITVQHLSSTTRNRPPVALPKVYKNWGS